MRPFYYLVLLWAATGCSLLFEPTSGQEAQIDAASGTIDADLSRFVSCESNGECMGLGMPSRCECGQCTLPDDACGSGRSWPEGARAELSKKCVPRPAQIAAGFGHTCVVVDDGTVRCWGENFDAQNPFGGGGRIGDGTLFDRARPTAVLHQDSPLLDVKAISVGNFHSCALLTTGTVDCWGGNWFGVLGNGSSCEGAQAAEAEAVLFGAGLTELDQVDAIASGPVHMCAIRSKEVWCWGNNQHLQVGSLDVTACAVPSTSHPIEFPLMVTGIDEALSVAGGQNHTCVVDSFGANEVRCFGRNNLSQLGLDNGGLSSPTPLVVQDALGTLAGAKVVTAGREYGCALDVNNEVSCWGENSQGELLGASPIGETATTAAKVPNLMGVTKLVAGDKTTCVIQNTGQLLCGGNNEFGQLMSSDQNFHALTPMIGGIREVAVGASHICAIDDQDRILCWGNQLRGRLGNGQTGPGVITDPQRLDSLCPLTAP